MTFRVANSIARIWFLCERFNSSISGRYVHHDYPISHRKQRERARNFPEWTLPTKWN